MHEVFYNRIIYQQYIIPHPLIDKQVGKIQEGRRWLEKPSLKGRLQ